jgi:hypothetical protein
MPRTKAGEASASAKIPFVLPPTVFPPQYQFLLFLGEPHLVDRPI